MAFQVYMCTCVHRRYFGVGRNQRRTRPKTSGSHESCCKSWFNAEKCKSGVTEVQFLGDIITHKGISTNPKLVKSLLKTSVPKNKNNVQRMLGVLNYFGKYVPHMSEWTANAYQTALSLSGLKTT